MRPRLAITVLAVCWSCVFGPGLSLAQDNDGDVARKVVNQVAPIYPSVVHKLGIGGNVRVLAVVAPNGKVKSVEVKGGHPMLAEAAADAVRKWRWVPAAQETRQPVIIKFDP